MGPNRQRSQALIEFALVSPVLLILLFGIIDIGRAIFYYDTINHAAREGARVAVRASNQLPSNADVLSAVNSQMLGVPVTTPCPQGPVTAATPPLVLELRPAESRHYASWGERLETVARHSRPDELHALCEEAYALGG